MASKQVIAYPRNPRLQYQHSLDPPPLPSFRNKPPPQNKPSRLLSPEENRLVYEILGRGRQALVTGIASILIPTPDQQQWQQQDGSGVVVICLVKDFPRRSYFIQAFSLHSREMVFSQEMYTEFQFHMPRETFLTFEGDTSVIAILFADRNEAFDFQEALNRKLEADRHRWNRKHNNDTYTTAIAKPRILLESNEIAPPEQPNHTLNLNQNVQTKNSLPFFSLKRTTRKVKSKRKVKLSTADIGSPLDFIHVQHVGIDPNTGFSGHVVDGDLRVFLEKAGVSDNQMKDEKTRDIILNFVQQNDVVGLVKRSNSSYSGATNIPLPPPPPPLLNSSGLVSPVPPPPPPPPPTIRKMIPTDAVDGASAQVQSVASSSDDRSQLLQQIQQGEYKLKTVEPNSTPKRNGGIGNTPISNSGNTMDDMASALARILNERHQAMNPDTSSSEDDDDVGIGDDEWDD